MGANFQGEKVGRIMWEITLDESDVLLTFNGHVVYVAEDDMDIRRTHWKGNN